MTSVDQAGDDCFFRSANLCTSLKCLGICTRLAESSVLVTFLSSNLTILRSSGVAACARERLSMLDKNRHFTAFIFTFHWARQAMRPNLSSGVLRRALNPLRCFRNSQQKDSTASICEQRIELPQKERVTKFATKAQSCRTLSRCLTSGAAKMRVRIFWF